jgi:hypothetical protein
MTPWVEGGPRIVVERERLDFLVLKLPPEVREQLALGPESDDAEPYACRVCSALDQLVTAHNRTAELLFDYHDEDGTEGEAAYRRCCDIYRAAGWRGEE